MQRRAILMMAVATVFFSIGGVLIKLSSWNGVALNGGRSLVAAGIIGAYVWWSGEGTWRISRLQIAGAIIYVLTQVTFAVSTQMTTAANAVFLQFTAPIWVAVLGLWLLDERPHWFDWVALTTILLGMGLFFQGELSATNIQGNLIAISSGLCLAFLVIILRKQKEGSPATTILLGNVLAALIGIPFMGSVEINSYEIGIVVMMGTLQLGIPFLLYSTAIKHLQAIQAILVQTLEPILNPVWVALIIAEVPTPLALAGCVLVFVTIVARSMVTR